MKIRDRIGLPKVIKFIEEKLSKYDTSQMDTITLSPKENGDCCHGYCYYPRLKRNSSYNLSSRDRTNMEMFKITTAVNVIEELYPMNHTHWARISNKDYQQGWVSGPYTWRYDSIEDNALHILAHEIFHFLSKSRQVRDENGNHIKNVETNCNWWADKWLEEFKLTN